jgi:hypothetical protein
MKTLIDGYRSFPGEHCGSVAMRGLLNHYCDLELSENAVFGLGAGLGCGLISIPEMGPSSIVFGRTATMEADLAATLGVDYEEAPEPDDERAWQDVREEVLAGRPTMLSGDILYLDYREFKVHFPGHRFVLLGFDDETEQVWIADRIREEPEVCSYGALFKSRNPPEGMSTKNLWGRFASGEVKNDLPTATRLAITTCANRMLGKEESGGDDQLSAAGTSGLAAIRQLAEELPEWGRREDSANLASYNASCIEKFGNGGGMFRRIYAGFLEWAHDLDPQLAPAGAAALATQAADGWTALAHLLWKASEGEDRWNEAAQGAAQIAQIEERLFEQLAA